MMLLMMMIMMMMGFLAHAHCYGEAIERTEMCQARYVGEQGAQAHGNENAGRLWHCLRYGAPLLLPKVARYGLLPRQWRLYGGAAAAAGRGPCAAGYGAPQRLWQRGAAAAGPQTRHSGPCRHEQSLRCNRQSLQRCAVS